MKGKLVDFLFTMVWI